MANRITKYAAMVTAKLDALDGIGLDGRPLSDFERELDLSPLELVAYQEAKSRAMLDGRITQAEAQTIYAALGESGAWPKRTSLAMKVTVTNLMTQLIVR